MQAWQLTRNTHEAAAFAALDVPVRPVTARDHKTGEEHTQWTLGTASTVDPARAGQVFRTGEIRRDFVNGSAQGALAATPLHPFLLGLRALHNRVMLLRAQRGQAVHALRVAPGSYLLHAGSDGAPPAPATLPRVITTDLDMAVALLNIGCRLLGITHNGREHVYTLARVANADPDLLQQGAVDGGALLQAARADAIFPARRWEHFPHALHTLHCLRELRARQHSTVWLTIRHRTYRHRGAALPEHADSAQQAHVQRTLGVRL